MKPAKHIFTALAVAAVASCTGAEAESYGFGVRGGPPAEVVYSAGSRLHGEGRRFGNLDSLEFHVTYVETLRVNDAFDVLAGADWRRIQSGVPRDAPLPDTLQSAALVLGGNWRVNDRWHARLEVLPGVYSDFEDISGRDFNAPFSAEVSYKFSENVTAGVQVSLDARREFPVVAFPGVRWRINERWTLNARIPRPQLEYRAADFATLFAGAQLGGGTYVVADGFGRQRGVRRLDGEALDFTEVRAGGGVRFSLARKLTAEISGGWTFDRRYNFHGRDYELRTDGAPFVQAGLGLAF
jgi:hypothetical protein